MPYIGRSMSTSAKRAHERGLRPMSGISSMMLRKRGFNYPLNFFRWLCKKSYIPKGMIEFHHASASMRMYRYYNLSYLPFIVETYHLENLYLLYKKILTKEEILRKRGISYIQVAVPGKKYGTRRIIFLDCLLIDGHIIWSPKMKIDMSDASVIKEYGQIRPNAWSNPNTKKILKSVLLYKKL